MESALDRGQEETETGDREMTYSEIRKLQDELDEMEATYSYEMGVPGSERLACRISRLEDELDEAKAGLPSNMLREWGIRS